MKHVALLDCNNFFVSCERLFRPDLGNKPVVVLSGNDGCVVARSNEVKDMGIPMGIPHFKVRNEFKDAGVTVFSSNFSLYHDISKRVMRVLREEVDEVKQYSIDEAFFSLIGVRGEIETELRRIKNAVETKVGIPVTLGAGRSKTIAKVASKIGKNREGVCLLEGKNWIDVQQTVELSSVWGIGPKISQRMMRDGLVTVADFLALPRRKICDLYSINEVRKYDELTENAMEEIKGESGSQQSIMSTHSLSKATNDLNVLKNEVTHHVTSAARDLRKKRFVATHMYIIMRPSRYGDWRLRGGSIDITLENPTDDSRVLLKMAKEAVSSAFEEKVPYKKVGVVFSGLFPARLVQDTLFAPHNPKGGELMKLLDRVNNKLGRGAITIGEEIHGSTSVKKNHLSPAYTTKWTDIRTVKT